MAAIGGNFLPDFYPSDKFFDNFERLIFRYSERRYKNRGQNDIENGTRLYFGNSDTIILTF